MFLRVSFVKFIGIKKEFTFGESVIPSIVVLKYKNNTYSISNLDGSLLETIRGSYDNIYVHYYWELVSYSKNRIKFLKLIQ